jgi:gamma-glutamyltranspeptidase/glutathione hydrolase
VAAPAIELAEQGFPVDIYLPHKISQSREMLEALPSLGAIYLPNGRVPEVGESIVQKDLANTLRKLVEAETGARHLEREAAIVAARDRFYRGDIAEQLVEYCQAEGGLLTMQDMAEFSVDIEPPVKTTYRGYEVYACGPWCQGPVVPQTLNLLEGYELAQYGHNSVEHLHILTEALKLAFSDRHHYYGDPRHVRVPIDGLLDKRYADRRRQQIDASRAWPEMPPPGDPWAFEAQPELAAAAGPGARLVAGAPQPDTSYLCVVDEEGNAFSCTPSDGFTDMPIVPGLGIIISSRGSQSWLEPGHPSSLAPRKRPRLTPNPGMMLKDGQLFGPYGTPGGDVQPQAMVQFLVNLLDFGMNPQAAVEAPRIASASHPDSFDPHPYTPGLLRVEAQIAPEVVAALEARGHRIEIWPPIHRPGRIPGSVCAVLVDREHGVLVGAADPRDMAYAIGW